MDDLISRQAAIDELMCLVKQHECDLMPDLLHWTGVKAMLESLPSAQPTGRWIDGKVKHIKNGELRNVRECSECGSSYFVYDYYNSVDEIPKFCPNCGARMEDL